MPGANTTLTQHFHLDHLGTPRLVSNDAGVRIGIHAYYPFGTELNLTPNEQPGELMKFTGHERDLLASNPNTLDYMHARYDMGTMGRFLSVDPTWASADLGHPQAWNRYSYVRNNPIGNTDPDGKICIPCAAVGALAAVSYESYRQVRSGEPVNNGRLLAAVGIGAVGGATLGEVPVLARAAFTAFPRTYLAAMTIGMGMTGTPTGPNINIGSGGRPIAGSINVDNLSAGFRGGMQQVQVAGDALALPFKNGSIGNVTAQNFPSVLLGQGGQQLAGELGRTMQSGSTLTITTQTPGALKAFGELIGETFKDVLIKGNVLTAVRQ
jgi:RHS repeat-associated protein